MHHAQTLELSARLEAEDWSSGEFQCTRAAGWLEKNRPLRVFFGLRVFVSSWPVFESTSLISCCADLSSLPLLFELLETHFAHRSPGFGDRPFQRAEPPCELVVGLPQRRLGFDAELARQVGDREEQIAHFFFGPLAAPRPRRSSRAVRRPPPESSRPHLRRAPSRTRRTLCACRCDTPEAGRAAPRRFR